MKAWLRHAADAAIETPIGLSYFPRHGNYELPQVPPSLNFQGCSLNALLFAHEMQVGSDA
jgi:hypothetical protein